ncbi:hypothetical protein Sjap_026147 [Stephania japonica]|uniref:Uncharacterized protein n=1 Tax=Stephania japonica TaxID=461633 RepID=A0AAP0E323_9MAGN
MDRPQNAPIRGDSVSISSSELDDAQNNEVRSFVPVEPVFAPSEPDQMDVEKPHDKEERTFGLQQAVLHDPITTNEPSKPPIEPSQSVRDGCSDQVHPKINPKVIPLKNLLLKLI